MPGKKHKHFHVVLKKEAGKLIHRNGVDAATYAEFVKDLEEGQYVDIFLDGNVDNNTLAQLAKIHACLKLLAMHLGYSFEDMKLELKRAAGLCIKKEIEGDMYMICKSFAKCSKDELSLVIQSLIDMGQFNGFDFS